jgi:hypothetical protein
VRAKFRVPVNIPDLLCFVVAFLLFEIGTVDLFFAFPIEIYRLI